MRAERRPHLSPRGSFASRRRSSVGSEHDVRGSFDDFWLGDDEDGGCVQGVMRPFGRARGQTLWEEDEEEDEEGEVFELIERSPNSNRAELS